MRLCSFVLAALFLGISFSHVAGQTLLEEPSWKQGQSDLAAGRAATARPIFEALLKKYPREPDLQLMYAVTSLRVGDVPQAEIHVRELLKMAPGHVEGWTFLGWLSLDVRKDFPAAIEAYGQAVRLAPNSPRAYNNLAVAFRRNGNLAAAQASLSRALALDKGFVEGWSNRGWVYFEEQKWPEARRDFEQALILNEKDEGALYGLSRVLRRTRDYAGAEAALGKLIGQSPNFVYWLEWAQVEMVRRYWVLLLAAIVIFGYSKFKKKRAQTYGS
ncbi:MAG TPA: tetratricopeptide repeat protein [Candidatus Binatia bacterium]